MNSTKSITEKLNFKKYPTKLILQMPEDLNEFNEIEYDSLVQQDKYDLIFIFVFHLNDMIEKMKMVQEKQLLQNKGYLFFAYPKKNNRKYEEYIERDHIFPALSVDEDGYIPNSDIKFARMVSLNDVFTVVGLKSEAKKVKKTANANNSQCVDDYIEHIEDIKYYLSNKEDLLKIYTELTPGYQKNWARYVYSAKRKETQEKRLSEMKTVLGEGYKSIDLYRRNKK